VNGFATDKNDNGHWFTLNYGMEGFEYAYDVAWGTAVYELGLPGTADGLGQLGSGSQWRDPFSGFTRLESATVEATRRRALGRLKANSNCAAFFGGAGASTLSNTTYFGIWLQSGGSVARTPPDSTSVQINVNGPFFATNAGPYMSYLRPGGLDLATYQELVFFHELGHELQSAIGFLSDKDSAGLNMINSLRVLNGCF
jgi:hypothetical protein